LPAFENVELFRNKIAVSDGNGDYLYEDVYQRSWDLAKGILDLLGDSSPNRRVCLLCPPDLTHVLATWSCWMSGHVAVPLCPSSHQDRLEHVIMESQSDLVITTVDQVNRIHAITKKQGQKLIVLDQTWWEEPKNESDIDRSSNLPPSLVDLDLIRDSNAYILYTSGMTGKPKGVLYNHQTVCNQIENVINSWALSSTDSVLHSLPLDTVYGSINSIQAPLSTGARITLIPNFDTTKIWSNLLGVGLKSGKPLAKINTFPSIPQVYTSLLKSYSELFKDKKTKEYVKTNCGKRMRLMISSTSSLPLSVSSQWKSVTGHKILDNFISTESGMGLESRETQIVRFRDHTKASHEVLVHCHGDYTSAAADDDSQEPIIGELRMKLNCKDSAKEYLVGNEAASIACDQQWFHTGDLVEFSNNSHKLWGKLNMNQIYHKGSIINTVDIEKKILSNKDIDDCYVLGLGDRKENQQLAAILVLTKTKKVNIDNILEWCTQEMKEEEIPTVFKMVANIERDNFGHIDKIKLRSLFNDEDILCFHDSKL